MSSVEPPSQAAPRAAIAVVVNGERQSSRAGTLADLLVEAGYGGVRVATALNGDFVPERLRATTTISDGDRIEVVSPRQGG